MGFKKEITMKEFIKFLLPSIAVMAFMSTYAIIDGLFIAKYVGSDALAAVNLILPMNSIIYSVGLMFAAGGGAYASIKLGQGDERTASQFFSNLMMVAVSFGLIIMALALIFNTQLLSFLGVSGELVKYASIYSIFAIINLPLLITKMIYAGFLRASGKPDISLKMSVIGGLANMVLDYVFIVVLGMGVAGAGLGTLLGILISLAYATRYFASKDSKIRFIVGKIDFKIIGMAMVNGSSEMVSELAIGFTAFILNLLMIKHYGKDGVAAIAVIMYINFFVSMVFQGIAIGVAPLLSYHFGAKNFKTLDNVRRYARQTLIVVSLLLTLAVLVFNHQLVSIFFASGNGEYRIAVSGLYVIGFSYLLMGANMYGSAMYTAFSNGKVSAIISFSKTFIIFAIAAYSVPKILGASGIWYILPMVELITAMMVFYLTRERQLKRYTGLEVEKVKATKVA